ncbi:hypothetical protein GQ53DRAFT_634124, partial [Thozetella sp. PMI_491]
MNTQSNATYKSPLGVVLSTSYDWRAFIAAVKKRAIDAGIWGYMDPDPEDTPLMPSLPIAPTLADFAGPNQQQLATNANRSVAYTDLTAGQKADYAFVYNQYRDDLREYKDRMKAIQDLRKDLTSSLGSTALVYIRDADTLADELRILKAKYAPSDHVYELAISRTYNRLKTIAKTTKTSTWLDRWEEALNEAIRLELPEVDGLRPVWDFLEAVKPLNPYF